MTSERVLDDSRTFGVELEFVKPKKEQFVELLKTVLSEIPRAKRDRVRFSDRYEHNHDNKEWVVKYDGSVPSGGELATRVLKGRKDIQKLADAVSKLSALGVETNHSCGFHVHIALPDFTEDDLGKLLALWIKAEPVIMMQVDPSRRANRYCPFIVEQTSLKAQTSYTSRQIIDALRTDRYTRGTINIANFAERKRVEFRVMEGSFEPDNVANWVRFLLHFVSTAKSLPMARELDSFILIQLYTALGLWEQECSYDPDLESARRWFLRRVSENAGRKGDSKLERADAKGLSAQLEAAFAKKMLQMLEPTAL